MTNQDKVHLCVNRGKYFIDEKVADKIMSCKYQRQAVEFLVKTKTTCEIESVGKALQPWGENPEMVNKYSVTLKNARHSYTFDWYSSIHSTRNNEPKQYDFYSVLAGLTVNYSTDFDDWCADFGYTFKTEREYIKVKQTYLNCLDEDKNLRKLFTSEELEQLQEIR